MQNIDWVLTRDELATLSQKRHASWVGQLLKIPNLPRLPWLTPWLHAHPILHKLHFLQLSICKRTNTIYKIHQNRWDNFFLIRTHVYWWIDTNNSLTGPCLHHKYVLKTSISAFSHSDACLRTVSGRIIRSSSLWFTGSSELDSTRRGAQRNSTVALYSWKLAQK